MSNTMQSLLRLPCCVRRQMYLDLLPKKQLKFLRKEYARMPKQRTFSTASRYFKETRTKPTARKTTAAATTLPPKAAPFKARNAAPPPTTTRLPPKPTSYLDKLLESGESVLLYRAPNHTSLFIFAYLSGGLLLIGALNWTFIEFIGPPTPTSGMTLRKNPWYITLFNLGSGVLLAVVGTAIFLAPSRTIRTISARVATPSVPFPPIIVRCEVRNVLPFMKPGVIEAPPSRIYLDRRISATEDIDFTSIPREEAQAFTSGPATYGMTKSRGGIAGAWAALRRDIRRMFLREGIAYMRFEGHGNCKLDLQGCRMLDWGRPLEKVTSPDPKSGVGVVASIRRSLGF